MALGSDCVLDIPCDEGSGVYLRNDSAVSGALRGRMVAQCRWKKMPTGIYCIRMPIFFPTPYVRVEHYAALNQPFTTNKVTMEAWVCLNRLPSEMNLEDEAEAWTKAGYPVESPHYGDRDFFKRSTVISKRHNGTTGYGVTINQYDQLNCDLKGLTPDSIQKFDMTVLQLKQWYHCVITWDGTNIKAYLNGGLQTGQAASGSLIGNSNWLGFGKHDDFKFFKGLMSRVRIYDYALTADTIASHYQAEAEDYGWPKFRITDMRDMVREVLNDYDVPYTASDKVMDRALSQVVSDFSQRHPYELITRLPVEPHEPIVELDRLEERIEVLKAEYPIGNLPPTYPDFEISADELRIKGYTESSWKGIATTYGYCNVHWTRRHDLEDAYTTVPDIYLDAIALGAAGHLIARSTLAESNDTWRRWANNAVSQFNRSISKHSERRRVRVRHMETGEIE